MLLLPAIAAVLLIKRARQTSQRPKPSPISPKHTATRSVNANMNVTVLGMGGASLGDLYVKISNEQAMKALLAAHQHHINLFDTSPWYGVGLSEARFGIALHAVPRQSFLLQTKGKKTTTMTTTLPSLQLRCPPALRLFLLLLLLLAILWHILHTFLTTAFLTTAAS